MIEPADRRIEPEHQGGERRQLEQFLDYHRETLVMKARGLTEEQANRPLTASGLTIKGLLKHLTVVEHTWFWVRMAGRDELDPWASAPWDDDPDWELHTAADDALAELIAAYEFECSRSRDIAAMKNLDDVAEGTSANRVVDQNLRWILIHMIEETARHNGHADLLREAADGATGE